MSQTSVTILGRGVGRTSKAAIKRSSQKKDKDSRKSKERNYKIKWVGRLKLKGFA